MDVTELNERFGIDHCTRFEPGNGGLQRLAITTGAAEATIYLHGAHVTHYQPRRQQPVLFMSRQSQFAAGKPIRGGVPICLPWFAAKEDDPSAPMHGFARLFDWTVESTQRIDQDRASVTLRFDAPPDSMQKYWPDQFEARYIVTVGNELEMQLQVTNRSSSSFTFTEALHSYLSVGDISRTSVLGLEGTEYLDKVTQRTVRQPNEPICFDAETDRVYISTMTTCVVDDRGLKRKIAIAKSGSRSTVVWNPWIAKAKALPDFADDEWRGMLCDETANTRQNPVTLALGDSHSMTAIVKVL
jgi:D-hexose-6-phosphate mutarotase